MTPAFCTKSNLRYQLPLLLDRHQNTCHAKNFLGSRTIFSATGREAFEQESDISSGDARCCKIDIRCFGGSTMSYGQLDPVIIIRDQR